MVEFDEGVERVIAGLEKKTRIIHRTKNNALRIMNAVMP